MKSIKIALFVFYCDSCWFLFRFNPQLRFQYVPDFIHSGSVCLLKTDNCIEIVEKQHSCFTENCHWRHSHTRSYILSTPINEGGFPSPLKSYYWREVRPHLASHCRIFYSIGCVMPRNGYRSSGLYPAGVIAIYLGLLLSTILLCENDTYYYIIPVI